MASTPTLASRPPASAARRRDGRLVATRVGLVGLSIAALLAFAAYAALLASRADEIVAPEPITVPSRGATTPFTRGEHAPNFTLPGVDGQPVSLADYAGRPVWVNVWASWCAPCRAEMPDIASVYQEQRAKDESLALLMVSVGEEPNTVSKYLRDARYQLPVLVDPSFQITEGYRITGLPTHYFIGRDGVIKDFAIGGLKPGTMRTRLAKIL